MPNVNKYFIVMDQLSNRLHSNGPDICSDGAFMTLIILLGLRGKWKCLRSLEKFVLGWKYNTICSCLEKVDRSFCSEKCQVYDKLFTKVH